MGKKIFNSRLSQTKTPKRLPKASYSKVSLHQPPTAYHFAYPLLSRSYFPQTHGKISTLTKRIFAVCRLSPTKQKIVIKELHLFSQNSIVTAKPASPQKTKRPQGLAPAPPASCQKIEGS